MRTKLTVVFTLALLVLTFAMPATAENTTVENICAAEVYADLDKTGINSDLYNECVAGGIGNGVPIRVVNHVNRLAYCRLVHVGIFTDEVNCGQEVEVGFKPVEEAEKLWSFSLTTSPRHNFPMFGNVASRNGVATGVLSRSFGGGWDLMLVGVGPTESHQEGALSTMGSLVLSKEFGRTTVGLEFFHAPPQYGAPHLTALVPQLSWTGDMLGREWNAGVQVLVMLDTEPLGEDGFIWTDWEIIKISRGQWTYTLRPGLVVGTGGRVTGHSTVKVEYDLGGDRSVYLSVLGARTKALDGTYSDIDPTPSVGVSYDF